MHSQSLDVNLGGGNFHNLIIAGEHPFHLFKWRKTFLSFEEVKEVR